jgi:hypothetical protein
MERIILWFSLLLAVVLLFLSFKKAPIKDWVIVYLLQAYLAIFVGVIVIEEKMLAYPVRFLPKYFDSNILYEYLILPVVCVYFNQTTYHSNIPSIILQNITYTSVVTIIEVVLEKYTNLIKYKNWNWMYTFGSTFLIMLFVRIVIGFIRKMSIQKR